MGYKLTSFKNNGILEITISDNGNKKNTGEIASSVFDLVKSSKPRCVLIDIHSIQGRIDISDLFDLVHNFPDDTPQIMTAIVDREGNRRKIEMDFFETVSVNMGYSTRYFTDMDAARIWLGE
jgi:hypothetical protein